MITKSKIDKIAESNEMLDLYEMLTNWRRELIVIKDTIEDEEVLKLVETADQNIWGALCICASKVGETGRKR